MLEKQIRFVMITPQITAKRITVALAFLVQLGASAQQIGPVTQFSSDPFFYNPAAAGVENNLELVIGYRNQWTGFEGSPQTFFASGHKAIMSSTNRSKDKKYLKGQVQNQEMFTTHTDSKFQLKHGIGSSFGYDRFGAFSRTNFGLAYAYHIPIKEFSLAAGVSTGISRMALDPEEAVLLESDDDTYSTYLTNGGSTTYLNINAGLYLYSDKYYFGYASDQLFPGMILSNRNNTALDINTHHYLSAGLTIQLKKDLKLKPNVLYGLYSGLPNSWHFNAIADYKNIYEGGMGVRGGDAITFQLGYRFKEKLKIAYAYDVNVSSLNRYNNGSHEMMITGSF